MAILKTKYAQGLYPMPIAQGPEVITVKLQYDLAAVLAINDVVELGFLPQDHVPVDYVIDNDDLSSTAAGTFDFGLLDTAGTAVSTAAADGNGKWITASTAFQAAAYTRAVSANHLRVVPSATVARKLGIVMAAACTVTIAGIIAVHFSYRAASYGS
jgi:hypothetical protein